MLATGSSPKSTLTTTETTVVNSATEPLTVIWDCRGSDPEAELAEMLLKARPLLEAVGGTLETDRSVAVAARSPDA